MRMNKQKVISWVEVQSPAHKLGMVILLLIITAGIPWYFFLGPNLTEIDELKSDLESLELDILRFSRHAALGPDLEQKAGQMERELHLARNLLPSDTQALERLLASFERLGNEKGVRFLLFQPGSEQINEFYATRSVQLRLEGRFHHLIAYFDALARLDRLVSLESLRLQPAGRDQDTRDRVLIAESRLVVYRALTPDELKP